MSDPLSVPLRIEYPGPSRHPQHVTVGVPFLRGAISDPRTLRAADTSGRGIPLQTQSLARWPDGSIQWLLLDFVAPASAESLLLSLDAGTAELACPAALRITETPTSLVIESGGAAFHLDRRRLPGLQRVVVGGRNVLELASARIVLTDTAGRTAQPRVESAVVEASGPVRATVRLTGTFAGRIPCRFSARLCFFAGTGFVRLRFTLHNSERARHRAGLWDLGDPASLLFRSLAMEMTLAGSSLSRLTWSAEDGQPVHTETVQGFELYQGSSGGENWQSRAHVNRNGKVPCSFRGYRVRCNGKEKSGLRASPVVSLHSDAGTVSAAIPEFWEQFPKAIEVEDRVLRLGLFPRQWGDLFELQGGERKTHTAWLHFGGPDDQTSLAWVHSPANVHADPQWYAASGAVRHLVPAGSQRRDRFETLLAESLHGDRNLFARREIIDEYGWRNFGELYADHEGEHYKGTPPVVSHFNNQYDPVYGLLREFWATGDVRWLRLGDPLARHVFEIDLYHTERDRPVYNGGYFWHTDHYRDAGLATHRAYSRVNCPPGGSYGGGPSNEHNYTTGLLHYHYLTGDPDARAAVLRLADWVLAMDDGTQTPFGLIDGGPSGWASKTGGPLYHLPGRGGGNSINALLDAWLLSGERRYLAGAEGLVRRCIHPADDLDALDLLNAECRWSVTVFLSVLARYLDLMVEQGERGASYAYGRAALLHYGAWMAEHERPYFDRPEELEFPNETWAAQELRKANVFRLAARHAVGALRARLLERGEEFAVRAWNDLFRFTTRTSTRALAIVLMEGPADSWLRAHPDDIAPPPLEQPASFGRPEAFVPQKERVRRQLRSLPGVARALGCLLDVRRWPRLRWLWRYL